MSYRSSSKILLGLLISYFALGTAASDLAVCENGPWKAPFRLGQPADTAPPFCESEYNTGHVVSGVKIWTDDVKIVSMKVYFSSERESRMLGRESPDGGKHIGSKECKWDPLTERVTSIEGWDAGAGEGVIGGIKFIINDGQRECMQKAGKTGRSHIIDTDAGILLGIQGQSGASVDHVRFLFLRSTVRDRNIIDIKFGDARKSVNEAITEANNKATERVEHRVGYYRGSKSRAIVVFANTEARMNSYSLTTIHTIMGSIRGKVGVKIESPKWMNWAFAKGSVEGEISGGVDVTDGTQKTETTEESTQTKWETRYYLPANAGLKCSAVGQKGTFSSKVWSTTKVDLVDGTSYEFEAEGQYDAVGWGQVNSKCDEVSIEEADGNNAEVLPDDPSETIPDQDDEWNVKRAIMAGGAIRDVSEPVVHVV